MKENSQSTESKEEKKVAPDAFIAVCPSREILVRVAEKWSMLVLVALSSEAVRFGALRRKVEGVSQKMLTQTLRNLERDGFIQRKAYNEVPLRVEYSLTEMGRSLLPLIDELKRWVEAKLFEIQVAQERYDHKEEASGFDGETSKKAK